MQILVESHQTKTLLLDMPRVGCQKGKAVSKKNTPIYTSACEPTQSHFPAEPTTASPTPSPTTDEPTTVVLTCSPTTIQSTTADPTSSLQLGNNSTFVGDDKVWFGFLNGDAHTNDNAVCKCIDFLGI